MTIIKYIVEDFWALKMFSFVKKTTVSHFWSKWIWTRIRMQWLSSIDCLKLRFSFWYVFLLEINSVSSLCCFYAYEGSLWPLPINILYGWWKGQIRLRTTVSIKINRNGGLDLEWRTEEAHLNRTSYFTVAVVVNM